MDENDIHVDLAKIQFICGLLDVETLTNLQKFLRLANFYHRFMLWFSHIAWPLRKVTKGGAKAKLF